MSVRKSMAEVPNSNFYPEGGSENSLESQFNPSFRYVGSSHSDQNVVIQFSNQNFTQTPLFVLHGQPSCLPGSDVRNNRGGQYLPPYVQYPPSWNNFGVPSCQSGAQQGGPTVGPGAVIPFNSAVPPPVPRFTSPPSQQQSIPNQGIKTNDKSASQSEAHGLQESDQMWIDSWIRHLPHKEVSSPHISVVHPKKKVRVWEVKQLLRGCLSLLGELEVLKGELMAGHEEMGETEWKRKLGEVETKKVMLSESLGILDEGMLPSLQSTLLKRGRKRLRQRGRHALDKELVATRVEKRRRLQLEADLWLEGKQAEVDLHKREEMLKQEADAVLWEVRRKQSEGRRVLSLLSALVKLHQVRVKKNDPASDPALSENEDQFQVIIDKLSSLWEHQMSEYEVEERALRVMLTESPEGGCTTAARDKNWHKATGDLQRSLRLWESLLFGTGSSMSQELLSLGTDSIKWLYLKPSKSLDALVECRRQWDRFISNSGIASSIPVGWVVPAEASSEEWKALVGSRGDFG